jgi:hypothetical protein
VVIHRTANVVFAENPLILMQFRVNQFAFFSSISQIASRNESRNLLLPTIGNSTQIHLGIGMGILCNVPANIAQKGFLKY